MSDLPQVRLNRAVGVFGRCRMFKRVRCPTVVLLLGWFFFGCAHGVEGPAPESIPVYRIDSELAPAPVSAQGQPGSYCECWAPTGGVTCGLATPGFVVHHDDGSECGNTDPHCSGACYVTNPAGGVFFQSELKLLPIRFY